MSGWSFAPQLREYFETQFTRPYSDAVLTVLHAGLRGAHVSIEVPAGGTDGRRWPAGTVTVFFQSSRHLQVSIWSEAFAILVDCLILAYYRFLRSSTAQDPTFDIDLGLILPEAIGLRVLLRRCGLVPDPTDGWSSI